MLLTVPDLDNTLMLGRELGSIINSGIVIFLNGDLGVGKTTFVKGLAAGLGVGEDITSPTFTMVFEYFSGKIPLYHFDFYKADLDMDFTKFTWIIHDLVQNPNVVIAIEWFQVFQENSSKNLTQLFLDNFDNSLSIDFSYNDAVSDDGGKNLDSSRVLHIQAKGIEAKAVEQLFKKRCSHLMA